MQKFAYGFLNLKPSEFWDLIPAEFHLMKLGIEQKQDYDFRIHVQTLRVLRHVGYTVYATTPKKKGQSNISLKNYLSLPLDNETKKDVKPVSLEDFERMKEFYSKKFK